MRSHADIERDLARLADGTLARERARELESRLADSPELRASLDEQRRSVDAVRMLAEPAPAALRARVESLRRRPRPVMRARRLGIAAGLAGAVAAIAVALVAILPSGAAGPSLSQAAAFTLRAPAGPAPSHSFDGALDLAVDGVPYPYLQDSLGWKAVGTRVDKVGDRKATTVFYRSGKQRVGYTIVSGRPLRVSGQPAIAVRDSVRFRILPLRGTSVVTWERKGHSCILSGAGVSSAQLLKLASWKDEGALPYSSGHR